MNGVLFNGRQVQGFGQASTREPGQHVAPRPIVTHGPPMAPGYNPRIAAGRMMPPPMVHPPGRVQTPHLGPARCGSSSVYDPATGRCVPYPIKGWELATEPLPQPGQPPQPMPIPGVPPGSPGPTAPYPTDRGVGQRFTGSTSPGGQGGWWAANPAEQAVSTTLTSMYAGHQLAPAPAPGNEAGASASGGATEAGGEFGPDANVRTRHGFRPSGAHAQVVSLAGPPSVIAPKPQPALLTRIGQKLGISAPPPQGLGAGVVTSTTSPATVGLAAALGGVVGAVAGATVGLEIGSSYGEASTRRAGFGGLMGIIVGAFAGAAIAAPTVQQQQGA